MRRSLATHCPTLVGVVVVDVGRHGADDGDDQGGEAREQRHAQRVASDAVVVRPRQPVRQLVVAERVVEHQLERPRRREAHRDLDQHRNEHDGKPPVVGPQQFKYQVRHGLARLGLPVGLCDPRRGRRCGDRCFRQGRWVLDRHGWIDPRKLQYHRARVRRSPPAPFLRLRRRGAAASMPAYYACLAGRAGGRARNAGRHSAPVRATSTTAAGLCPSRRLSRYVRACQRVTWAANQGARRSPATISPAKDAGVIPRLRLEPPAAHCVSARKRQSSGSNFRVELPAPPIAPRYVAADQKRQTQAESGCDLVAKGRLPAGSNQNRATHKPPQSLRRT